MNATSSFAKGKVTLASLSATSAGRLTLSGSGTLPLSGNGLNVTVNGSALLVLANRFVADRDGQLSGVMTMDARVSGSLTNPQFSSRVATSGAGYVDPELNFRMQGITGSASLNGDHMVIEQLSTSLARGGFVSASGSIGLSGGLLADVQVAINSVRYADGDLFIATVSGNLALTGNLTGSPLLAGNMRVENANITVPENFDGGDDLIDV